MEAAIGNADGYAGSANQVARGVTLFPDRGDFCIGGFFCTVLASTTDMPFFTKKWVVRKKAKSKAIPIDLRFSQGNASMVELVCGTYRGYGRICGKDKMSRSVSGFGF